MYETKQNIPAEALTAPSRPKVCQTAYNWCCCAGAVPQHDACSPCSSRTLLASCAKWGDPPLSAQGTGCGPSSSSPVLISCLLSIRFPVLLPLAIGFDSLKQGPAFCSLPGQYLARRSLDPWLKILNVMAIEIMLSMQLRHSCLWQNGEGVGFTGVLNFPFVALKTVIEGGF